MCLPKNMSPLRPCLTYYITVTESEGPRNFTESTYLGSGFNSKRVKHETANADLALHNFVRDTT